MSQSERDFLVGPLAFRFNVDTGFVRDIRFRGREFLRGIYPAVRDRKWQSLDMHVESVQLTETPDSLKLCLEGHVTAPEAELIWSAEIEARAIGALRYAWHGRAMSDCITNRTGLCVLHPAESAGSPCMIEHVDGTRTAGWLPENISPHQPFRDIRAITHVIGIRSLAEVRMEGAVFEMEDQRNWTDASFKTYSRPLIWPYPYRLEAGAEIEQSVTVEVRGDTTSWEGESSKNGGELEPGILVGDDVRRLHLPPNVSGRAGREPRYLDSYGSRVTNNTPAPIQFGNIQRRMPNIGFTLPGPLPPALRDRLRSLRPHHVRVETNMAGLEQTLEWAIEESVSLDCVLELAICGATTAPPKRSSLPKGCVVLLFDEMGNSVGNKTLATWNQAGFANLATGTLNHFAELNRNRPPADGFHTHTVFGVNAQVHASDDQSIQETLSQHAVVARAAHRLGGERPVLVSPISMGRSASSIDPRLHQTFGARWLWESLDQLSSAGCVESATYFYTHGPAGFMAEDKITPVEELLHRIARDRALPTSSQWSA